MQSTASHKFSCVRRIGGAAPVLLARLGVAARSFASSIKDEAAQASVRLFLAALALVGLPGISPAHAAPDQPVFGPKVFTQGGSAPQTFSASFALPPDVTAP